MKTYNHIKAAYDFIENSKNIIIQNISFYHNVNIYLSKVYVFKVV